MAQRTVARMYDNYEDAKMVVHDLEAFETPYSDISLGADVDAHVRSSALSSPAATGGANPLAPADHDDTDGKAGSKRGAVFGTVLAGGRGLLAGIGALPIPGIGPVVAAGWLVAPLVGAGVSAASGGLIGSLTGAGVSGDEAHVYAHGIKGGGSSLATVQVNDADAASVEAVLGQCSLVDWQHRRTPDGADWKVFDDSSSRIPCATGSVTPSAALPGPGSSSTPSARV